MAVMMKLMELMASCDFESSGDHHHHGHHQLMASCDGWSSGDVKEGQA